MVQEGGPNNYKPKKQQQVYVEEVNNGSQTQRLREEIQKIPIIN